MIKHPKLNGIVQKAGPRGGNDAAGAIADLAQIVDDLMGQVETLEAAAKGSGQD